VRDIKHDDERAGEVIRRLRQLLAKAPLESQEIDLNAMLGEVFEFLSGQAAARRITLSTRMTPQAPCVDGDRIQLQQVILNLVMNAMDAIGTARQSERAIIGRTLLADGGFAEVWVEDTGPGIPSDKAKQIFEPFFTTKSSGMGMGLSIARTIIERHGGKVWAENKKSGGAVFRFTLPLSGHRSRARTAEPNAREESTSHAAAPLGGMLAVAKARSRPTPGRVDSTARP